MVSVNISLKQEAYKRLVALKRHEESFSDELRRLLAKGNIMELAGAWNDISNSEAEYMKGRINKEDLIAALGKNDAEDVEFITKTTKKGFEDAKKLAKAMK